MERSTTPRISASRSFLLDNTAETGQKPALTCDESKQDMWEDMSDESLSETRDHEQDEDEETEDQTAKTIPFDMVKFFEYMLETMANCDPAYMELISKLEKLETLVVPAVPQDSTFSEKLEGRLSGNIGNSYSEAVTP